MRLFILNLVIWNFLMYRYTYVFYTNRIFKPTFTQSAREYTVKQKRNNLKL